MKPNRDDEAWKRGARRAPIPPWADCKVPGNYWDAQQRFVCAALGREMTAAQCVSNYRYCTDRTSMTCHGCPAGEARVRLLAPERKTMTKKSPGNSYQEKVEARKEAVTAPRIAAPLPSPPDPASPAAAIEPPTPPAPEVSPPVGLPATWPPLTEEQVQLLRPFIDAGMGRDSDQAVADATGRSRWHIRGLRERHGIPPALPPGPRRVRSGVRPGRGGPATRVGAGDVACGSGVAASAVHPPAEVRSGPPEGVNCACRHPRQRRRRMTAEELAAWYAQGTPAEYCAPAALACLQLRPGEAIPWGVTASRILAAQARLLLADDGVYLDRGPRRRLQPEAPPAARGAA